MSRIKTGLSPREFDVMRCLLISMTDREIAGHLRISINTVKRLNQGIFRYLGISGRCDLMPLMESVGAVGYVKKARAAHGA